MAGTGKLFHMARILVVLRVSGLMLLAAVRSPPLDARAESWADARRCGPFECRADYRLDASAAMFTDLSRLADDTEDMLGVAEPEEPIELYLFRDERSFRSYVAARFPDVPYRRALYVKSGGIGTVLAYRHRDLAIDVRHETTHALLHAALPHLPLWLDEGLAEYFEIQPARRSDGHPYLSELRPVDARATLCGLSTLERLDDRQPMEREQYRSAWAWVHFLLHGPLPAHQELQRYLADLRREEDRDALEPLSQRLARRLPDVDAAFARHVNAWTGNP
jgi:hypothetical protein